MSIFFKENLILVSIINDNYDYVFKGYLYKYFCSVMTKELSFCQKLKSSDSNIFAILWCKPLIFQT